MEKKQNKVPFCPTSKQQPRLSELKQSERIKKGKNDFTNNFNPSYPLLQRRIACANQDFRQRQETSPTLCK